MARRILRAKPKHVSLVPRGANRLRAIYKSDDGTLSTLLKAGDDFEEKGELLAVVYAPEHRDGQGDIASAEVIKEMCHEFSRNGAGIDIRHNEQVVPKSKAYVAENFVIQKGDERFDGLVDKDGQPVDPAGGWGMLIKIDDPDLRELYRDGHWDGVSLHAPEALLRIEKSHDEDRILNRLFKALGLRSEEPDQQGDDDMNASELSKALEPLTKGIEFLIGEKKEAIKKQEEAAAAAAKAPARAPFKAPVMKGERTPLNIKEHALKVRLAKAEYDTEDFTNAEATDTFLAISEDIQKELDEIQVQKAALQKAKGEGKSAADQEIAALEARIEALKKSSNQQPSDGVGSGGGSTNSTNSTEIKKEHTEPAKRMAAFLNGTQK